MVSIAFAQGAAAGGGSPAGGFGQFIPLVLIFVVFYFLLIRPQQKKSKDHQTFLGNLKKGDAVISSGGMHGVITGITDKVVTLEIADNVRVKVSRQYILGSVSSMTAATPEGGKAAGG